MLKRDQNQHPLNAEPDEAPGRHQPPSTDPSAATPLITLFAIPKPFTGQIATLQRNAVRSWHRLGPQVELLLFGDDESLHELADEVAATVLPVQKSEFGTPILSKTFSDVHRCARGRLLLYVNSDILLSDDVVQAGQRLSSEFHSFMGFGRRTDLSLQRELAADADSQWRELFKRAQQSGRPSAIVCKDYFLFTRDLFCEVPDFLVGRGNWDNWMVFRAKSDSVPVVDLSSSVTAIHQTHGYGHVPGGRRAAYITGQEAKRNQRLAGGRHLVSGSTATWRLTDAGIFRNRFPVKAFLRDLPRFLALLRNLMFLRYFFAVSAFLI